MQFNAIKWIALQKLPTTPASVSQGLLKKEKDKKYLKQADFVVQGNKFRLFIIM